MNRYRNDYTGEHRTGIHQLSQNRSKPHPSHIGGHARPEASKDQYVNQKEMRVIGMSRSGNHAIINWILAQADGHTCFLNCAEGKTNPFVSARLLHNDLPYEVNYPGFHLEQERRGEFSQKDLLLYSYEDNFLGYVCHPHFEQHHDQWVGKSRQRYDLLILRDPFNLFASRQRAGMSHISIATALRIWKQHAREFLGLCHHLNQPRIVINYNRWATDQPYRQQIAAKLGLSFTDAHFNSIHGTGVSSFDGFHYDGEASKMKIMERWKVYRDDLTYRQILEPELINYARQIFGPLPGIEDLFR